MGIIEKWPSSTWRVVFVRFQFPPFLIWHKFVETVLIAAESVIAAGVEDGVLIAAEAQY